MNTKAAETLIKAGRYSRSFLISLFTKKISKQKFDDIYLETRKHYEATKDSYDYKAYAMPEWQENTNAIEKYFLNDFSISFLRNQTIKKTMFMYTFAEWKNIQKRLIAKNIDPQKAVQILREFNIGKPLLNDWEYLSSGNNIHLLYHLLKFFSETKASIDSMRTVVEVGGGYGNMAKIFKKLRPISTYVIIDIPIFSYIQALYLRTIFDTDEVNFLSKKGDKIELGKINIVPLNEATIRDLKTMIPNTDLFLSTWALSESNQKMQNLIKELGYFNARYLLLAYQKSNSSFGFAENIKDVKPYSTLFNAETEYLKDNYYLFAKK